MGNWVFLFLIFSFVCAISYSIPVTNENDSEKQASDKDVKELESLRIDNHKIDNEPSETSVAPQEAVQPTATPKADDETEPQPNSRSAIFRHRGITQAKKKNYWKNQRVNNEMRPPKYSPADLAAYVFNTGDEEGVAVAVEELVREGMMGRTDAINYLQDVKQILNDMREERIEEFRKQLFTNSLQEDIIKRDSTTTRPDLKRPPYSFTLDVIYKLAKDMFTQSILRDDPIAEETLSGLVTFLENEVGNKRISSGMKEKVLEVVSAALVDSLREYSFDGQRTAQPLRVPMYRKGPENVSQLSTNKNTPKSS